MKKLPKIYKNNIEKSINNNREMCSISNDERITTKNNSNDLLDEIFNGEGYSYNKNILIKTTNKIYDTNLVARTKNNILTIDNEIIPINEIIEIQKKKD